MLDLIFFFLNRKPRDLQKPNENKILFELEIEKKKPKAFTFQFK